MCITLLVLFPTPGGTFSSVFGLWASTTKAPADPCASAVEPEKCHYNQAITLLASMTSAPSASKVPLTAPVLPKAAATLPVVVAQATPRASSVLRTTAAVKSETTAAANSGKGHEDRADLATKDKQSVAILMALGTLEGEDLPADSLESATMQLEDALDQLEPGALAAFRARRLAEAMNHHGPPKAAETRATEALVALQQVNWLPESAVAGAVRDLQSIEKPQPFSFLQWVQATNSESSGQIFVLLVFVVSILMIDRVAQDAALLPQYEENIQYGAMGHTPPLH